jgi:electron transport complex protein RnfD
MENQNIIISASPHVHDEKTVRSIMKDVLIAMIPAFLMGVYLFGVGTLVVTATAVISCVLFEYLLQKFWLKKPLSINDYSAVITGVLLAFNLPSNLPLWMVVVGSLVAIGVAKMSFGGLGFNIFNPALVGRVFLLISFPVQMTSWPLPIQNRLVMTDAITGATPLGIVKEGQLMGENMLEISSQLPSQMDLFYGFSGGSLGEMSAIALLIGGLYLLYRKVISWHIPLMMLLSMAIISGIFWVWNPDQYLNPVFHILTGGAILGAFFMATDMVTSPMTHKGMLIFAFGIGLITILIRLFGAYPEGVSFAILIMNALVPLINTYTKPRRFGAPIKAKFL